MDLKDIQNLIKFVAKSGANEVKLEMEDIKITIKTGCDHEAPAVRMVQEAVPATELQQAIIVNMFGTIKIKDSTKCFLSSLFFSLHSNS